MKLKLSRRNLLLLKANKILKNFYNFRSDLTEQEIVLEVSSMLKKWDDAIFLAHYGWMNQMEKSEWKEIVKKS